MQEWKWTFNALAIALADAENAERFLKTGELTKQQALLRVNHVLQGFRTVAAQDLTDSQRAALEYHLPRVEKIKHRIEHFRRRKTRVYVPNKPNK